MSVVVEADGAVRPCFFHHPVGNVRRKPLERIVKEDLPRFRSGLDVGSDPVCQRCVCSLKAGLRSALWA
jgi:radical SAM protein with 4Fe4S-binding SPASM domain